jgi:hypothetical protein
VQQSAAHALQALNHPVALKSAGTSFCSFQSLCHCYFRVIITTA